MKNQNKIVILGGGFAGLQAVLTIAGRIANPLEKIILIDTEDTNVYTPDLYEIATAYHEKVSEECYTTLKDTVAVPFSRILKNKALFIRDEIISINPEKNTVILKRSQPLIYDFLAITLGSNVNFYDIPGLAKFSLPFKTVKDAISVNCHVEQYLHALKDENTDKHINITVGGGGATGVELACELFGWTKKMRLKYGLSSDRVKISLVEASDVLVGKKSRLTDRILKRLKKLDISVLLNTKITAVSEKSITVKSQNGKNTDLPADILIWTGGVLPNTVIEKSFPGKTKEKALRVNHYLQNETYINIFAGGDNAYIWNGKSSKRVPLLAQTAMAQGKIIGMNILAMREKRPLTEYHPSFKGIIVPLGGKHGIFQNETMTIQGLFPWIMRRLVSLFYSIRILPFFFAVKKWIVATDIYEEND